MLKKIKSIVLFSILTIGSIGIYFYNPSLKEDIEEDDEVTNNDLSSSNKVFLEKDVYIPLIDYWLTHLIIVIVISMLAIIIFISIFMNKNRKDFINKIEGYCVDMIEMTQSFYSKKLYKKTNKVIKENEELRKFFEETIRPFFSENACFYKFVHPEKKDKFLTGSGVFFIHFLFTVISIIFIELIISFITFFVNKKKYSLSQIFIHLLRRLFQNKKSFFNLVIIFFAWFFYLFFYFNMEPIYKISAVYKKEQKFFDMIFEKDPENVSARYQEFCAYIERVVEVEEKESAGKLTFEKDEIIHAP